VNVREFFFAAKKETAGLLGFTDLDALTATQTLKLDVATSLRLEIDRLQSQQLRGEAADIRTLLAASEMLERLLLRPAEAVVAGADQFSGAREEFARLIDGLVAANEVTEATHVQELEREVSDLREQLARSRAGAAPPAPSAPTADVVPLRPDPAELAKRAEAERLKAIATAPRDEPWRPFVDASGIRTSSHGNFNVHGIPKGW
jgi:hypothetical protein